MLKCSLQPNYVLLVLWIRLSELVQDCYLLQPGFIPKRKLVRANHTRSKDAHRFLRTDNLDRNLFSNLAWLALQDSSPYDVCEHTLSERRKHLIMAAVKLLTQNNLVVSFGIGC